MTKKQENRARTILRNKGISEGTYVNANGKEGVCRISTRKLNDIGEVPFEYITEEDGETATEYVDSDDLEKIV